MGRTARVLWVILTGVLVFVFLLEVAEPESGLGMAAPQSLAYVESSGGLIPPTMEGGRTEVEMGDVNGDGYLDLVSIGDHGSPYVNTDQHGVMVWFGDGTGSWSVYQNGDFGYGGVALGDVNGDGLVDVGYGMHHAYSGTDFGDQLLEVALGDGTGQNWTPWDDGLGPGEDPWGMFGTDFADVDNDGDVDVGSVSFGCCDGVHVYLNQGDGTWVQSFGFVNGNSDMHAVFGDVNGDGNADLAVSQEFGTVYLGDGTGGFQLGDGNLPPTPWTGRPGVSLGDVNHDGRDDLAFCSDNGGVEVWGWVGPDTWQDLSGSLPGSGPYKATQLFDMDMDGHLDVTAFGDGQVQIWAGDGTGGWTEIADFTTPSPGTLSAFRVGGDADHNGFPDIVLVADEGSWPNDQNHIRFFKEASAAADLEIKPVFPLGQETFIAGGIVFVDWISAVPSGGPGLVSLELSTQGPDGPWAPIAADLPNGGRYQWHIPPDTVTTDDAYIRYTMVVTPETAVAMTPGPFSILGVGEEPIWGLEAINDSPTALGQITTLTATVISGTNVLYDWAFGDGAGGNGAEVAHVYPGLGVYTAAVTASNSLSLLTARTTVTITDAPLEGLEAANDSPTPLGSPTTLTATLTAGSNVTYTWALGDGTVGYGAVLTHTYPAVGYYTALVTASNIINALTATTAVTITDVPIQGLVAANDSPTPLGRPTTFTATVTAGSNVAYTWDLGDGTAAGAVVTHTYSAAGIYTCLVTASNSAGSLTATAPVTITWSGTTTYLPWVQRTLTYRESSGGLIPPTMTTGPTEVEMGDVNGDGYLDLVSIGDSGSGYAYTDEHGVMVWFGDGTGAWSVYQNGDFGYGGMALGDVNGDGLVDVGYGMHNDLSDTDFGDQLLEVALGDGTGQNWSPWDDGLATNGELSGMIGTDFADVDNDGDLDVGSVSAGYGDGVHVYLNQGDGTWVQSFGFLEGNSDYLFVFGDVNGDGNADLAVSHEYGTVYQGDGTGNFVLGDGNLPPLFPIDPRPGVSLGDVDHDGRDDLAFCSDNGGVEVWGWVGPDNWQDLSGSLPGSGSCEATQLFDMDMDGHLDVAAFGDGQGRIWAGDGVGGWTAIAVFRTPWPGHFWAFRVGGDADHNGFPDIVVMAEEGIWPLRRNHIRFFKEASAAVDLEIKPVSPLGEETFVAGGIVFVDWISAVPSGGPGTVGLELSTHGPGGPWEPIAAGLPNGGRYQWHIPPDTITTNDAYIRYILVVTPEAAVAVTPRPFTILGAGEEPIWELEAISDSPTALGQTTTLTTTVISRTHVLYD